jgi:tellurite resistance protein TerC
VSGNAIYQADDAIRIRRGEGERPRSAGRDPDDPDPPDAEVVEMHHPDKVDAPSSFGTDEEVHPEKNILLRLAKKFFPIASDFHGQKFAIREQGRFTLTPLALVLLVVETTDLIFAVDSIPAIFCITDKGFIVFTSNVFAILGLRSLYFVLAGAMDKFRYLKPSLSAILIFVGAKMCAAHWVHLEPHISLAVIVGILGLGVGASFIANTRDKRRAHKSAA